MISIIIPAYHEEKIIAATLNTLIDTTGDQTEIIVVDASTTDETASIAAEYPVHVIRTKANRARQMNQGALQAKGDILLFLHADSVPEEEALSAIERTIAAGYVGGALRQHIEANGYLYRWIERSGNIRARRMKVFYGDQALFARKDVFFKAGGFTETELFEDVFLSQELKKWGDTCALPQMVRVSPRRWQSQGIVPTTLIYWILTAGLILRIPPRILGKLYKNVR